MSAPTFKIVDGWLHADGYRINLDAVTKYWLFLPGTVSIYQGAALTVLSDIKIVDALDEWFERDANPPAQRIRPHIGTDEFTRGYSDET